MKIRLSQTIRAVAVSVACGVASAPASAADPGIVVYNAQHETLTAAWAEGFTADTGIPVTVRNGSDLEMANQILQEGDSSPADVFLTENSPGMVLVDKGERFESLPADILDQVGEPYRPANGHWVGIAARSTVFAYDKTKLKEDQLPKSILNLADPAWKGRWGASPAGADFQAIVAAMLALKGEEATKSWLHAMAENSVAYRGNRAAMAGVNKGEVEGAVIYHYYYFGDQARTKESSGNVALHYFRNQDPGAFVSISGGGVLASAPHKEQALAFLKWVTGPRGQAILREGDSFEYAVGEGQASNSALVPLAELDAPRIDPATLESAKISSMMRSAGLL